MEYQTPNPCNKCEFEAKAFESFYRHATPEFIAKRIRDNLTMLCTKPECLNSDCLPLLRRNGKNKQD